jgi:hypothetical protein
MKINKSSVLFLCLVLFLLIGMPQRASYGAAASSTTPAAKTDGNGNRSPVGYACSSYRTTCTACVILSCVCTAENCTTGYYDAGKKQYPFTMKDSDETYVAAEKAVATCCK